MNILARAAPFRNRLIIKSMSPMLTRCNNDLVTHTGQQWDVNDYRNARFMNNPKMVNPNWAVELIAQVPIIRVKHNKVWCDGGGGPEGHPRVYINLDKPGAHSCGYCGLRFCKDGHEH